MVEKPEIEKFVEPATSKSLGSGTGNDIGALFDKAAREIARAGGGEIQVPVFDEAVMKPELVDTPDVKALPVHPGNAAAYKTSPADKGGDIKYAPIDSGDAKGRDYDIDTEFFNRRKALDPKLLNKDDLEAIEEIKKKHPGDDALLNNYIQMKLEMKTAKLARPKSPPSAADLGELSRPMPNNPEQAGKDRGR